MVRVSIEVGAVGFRVDIVAKSIRQALGIVKSRYPGADARVVFPLEPGTFFVADPATTAGTSSRCRGEWRAERRSNPKGKVRA